MATQRQQVIDFISKFPDRDDDEIAASLKFSQRQTVNLICRTLAAEGLLDRTIGHRGKLVNRLRDDLSVSSDAATATQIEITPRPKRPPLRLDILVDAGFQRSGIWVLDTQGCPRIEGQLPVEKGVYAFASNGTILYVGVTGMGLKKRLYYYGKPGPTQTTNIRVNALIRESLVDGEAVSILTATPPDFEWGGLVVNGRAGLEVGLIESFYLPWNVRGAV